MNRIAHYVHRARTLGPAATMQRIGTRITREITWTGQTIRYRFAAKSSTSDALFLSQLNHQWLTVADLLEHLENRPASSFVLSHDTGPIVSPILNEHFHGYSASVIAYADRIKNHEFHLFDLPFHYPHGVDWHRDPITGWRCPPISIHKLDHVLWASSSSAELRVLWELNRHQFFPLLGMAFCFTGDETYTDTFITLLLNWIESNPAYCGINWYSSLEVALRLISWVIAFQLFRHSPLFRERAGSAFLKSLLQQTQFLRSHLTDSWDVPNNHVIGELTALILVGSVFPEFNDAQEWQTTGLKKLNMQLHEQTFSDGVNKEQATGYHRFVIDFLLLLLVLERHKLLSDTAGINTITAQMLDYMMYLSTPDDQAIIVGDSDDGAVLSLNPGGNWRDFRSLLATGAVLYDRPDWKYVARNFAVETFWLSGQDGLKAWQALEPVPPLSPSRAFKCAGVFILRDDWSSQSDLLYFRCGTFGLGDDGPCAHAHCDLLSPVLWIAGQPLLVDAGTYSYHDSLRNTFRQTGAHNTLMVDDHEQGVVYHLFAWQGIPAAECVRADDHHVIGRMQVIPGIWHEREIRHPSSGNWLVRDRLTGQGKHQLKWFFHFAPELTLHQHENHIFIDRNNVPFAVLLAPLDVCLRFTTDSCSSRYLHRQSNPLLVATWEGECATAERCFQWEFQHLDSGESVL